MNRKFFLENVGGLDERFGTFFQEPQEIGFKVFMLGGRMVINKHTWYAHWHKDVSGGYGFSNSKKKEAFRYSTWYWMNDQWERAIKKMEDFIAFHWPVPSWPENWKEEKEKFERTHPHPYDKPPVLC